MKRMAIGIALVSATVMGLPHASHAMSLAVPSAVKQAVPSHTSEVFWRGGWGPGIGFGIAAGALTAAALASGPYWGGGYWGGGYAYAPAYGYAPAYAYAPASYAYGPAYGYGPAYSYAYGPGYPYAYGGTYVRPRARYVYGRVGPRVRYGSTWGPGVRHTYRAGPGYRGSMTTRVVNRRR
jgi:hypothetical protein